MQLRLPGHPWLAVLTVIMAVAASTASFILGHGARIPASDAGLAITLAAALAFTYHFPIHVEHRSKIYIGSVVLFLIAALVSPAIAPLAAGAGIAAGELSTCRRTGNHQIPPIIPTQTGRWMLIALAGSLVAHATVLAAPIALVGAGVVMWSGDILTGPLLLSPLLGRGPVSVVKMMVREGGVLEGVQYVIGLLGAAAAREHLWLLLLLLPPAAAVQIAFRRAHELSVQTRDLLEQMVELLDQRDHSLGDHARRTAELARTLVAALGMAGAEVDLIATAALLHDIGMLSMPDDLLHKNELTAAEQALLRLHAERGAEVVGTISRFSRGAMMIRHHHEAWDGSGYPDGLRGAGIPFGARVIAVAEAYDAMTHERPGRPALSAGRAAHLLHEGRGRQWDPEIVDALLRSVPAAGLDGTGHLRLVREAPSDDQ